MYFLVMCILIMYVLVMCILITYVLVMYDTTIMVRPLVGGTALELQGDRLSQVLSRETTGFRPKLQNCSHPQTCGLDVEKYVYTTVQIVRNVQIMLCG